MTSASTTGNVAAAVRGGDAATRLSVDAIRRAELVNAAIVCITRHGFDGTTVRMIATQAGASLGSVHYYFQTKNDLLQAAFEHSDALFQRRVAAISATAIDPVDSLRSMLRACFDDGGDLAEWAIVVDLWHQAARQEDLREAFNLGSQRWVTRLSETVKSAQDTGAISPTVNAHEVAVGLAALVDGLGIYRRVTATVDSSQARRVLDVFVDSLTG